MAVSACYKNRAEWQAVASRLRQTCLVAPHLNFAAECAFAGFITCRADCRGGFTPVPSSPVSLTMAGCCLVQNYVGVIQVNSAHLKAALLPAPSQLLAELSALLPRCAALLYSNFIAHVHDATSRLSARTTSVEEYVEKLSFMATLKVSGFVAIAHEGTGLRRETFRGHCSGHWQHALDQWLHSCLHMEDGHRMTSVCCVQAHEHDFDESYAEVQAIYELVAEYALPVAALDMAAFHTLVPDYTAMRHAIDEVESAQDEQAQSYAMELASGDVPTLPINVALHLKYLPAPSKRCQVRSSTGIPSNAGAEAIKSALIEIRNAAQAETVLNLGSDQESVVRYLTDLQQRVAEQQAEAARIVKHQKFLKVPEAVNDELGAAAEEVRAARVTYVRLLRECVPAPDTGLCLTHAHSLARRLQGIGAALHTPWPSCLAQKGGPSSSCT